MTVALAVIGGYVLFGSSYLIIKTAGTVQERAYARAFRAAWIVLAFQVLVTIWTPFHYPSAVSNWFSPPRIYFIWIFPLIGLFAFYQVIVSLKKRREILPFVFSVVFFFAGYLGLIASIFPYVVPPSITFEKAAAQQETLRFTLWGVIIVLPLVLGYTVYSYRVFRGKVGTERYY